MLIYSDSVESVTDRQVAVVRALLLLGSRMQTETARIEILQLMLIEVLREAELLRPYDPVRAAHLDEAANDLFAVIAERASFDSDSEARH